MADVLVNAVWERDGVRLFGREHDVHIEVSDGFFVTRQDAAKFPSSWRRCLGEPEGDYVHVEWPERAHGSRKGRLRHYLEEVFLPRGINPLEADVDPVQRFIIDHPRIRFTGDWRLFWYDLETERVRDWERPWHSRILSFSWRNSDGQSGHVRLEARTDEAERELLLEFVRLANRHDIILAWNGSRFDDRVVTSRCELLDVAFDDRLCHWLDHLTLFKRYYLRTEDGSVTSSFALDSIAAAFLGEERKVPVEARARSIGWDESKGDLFVWLWEQAPQLLREYNDQDVHLMGLLEEKTGFVRLHLALAKLCRVLPSQHSLYATRLVDGKMFQRGRQAGYRFPTKRILNNEYQGQARGAFVPQAVIGLHDSVAVLDYSRMYPSIIRTFNLSLETLDPSGDIQIPETDEQGRPTGQVLARFRSKPQGHLPAALGEVLQERKQYSEAQSKAEVGSPEFHDAGRLSTACKVLANSFYGVVLSPGSRYYVREVGESVTTWGRLLLSSTIRAASTKGHRLMFGDTDSVAIQAADEEARALKDHVNDELIPRLVTSAGVNPEDSEIEIDYEKRYARVIVTASKRYAGRFALYKGKPASEDTPFDIRGLEIVRSDVCKAARLLQRELIEDLLKGASANAAWDRIQRARSTFEVGGWGDEDQLILAKSMTKPPAAYASKPMHVRIAERLIKRGAEIDPGGKIPFVLTKSGPLHPSELDGAADLDRVEYWNKYVYPPTRRVLEAAFPDWNWDAFVFAKGHDPNQLTLFDAVPKRRKEAVVKVQKKKVRKKKVRKKKVRGFDPVVLEVDDRLDSDRASRLRELAEAYPGRHPLRINVRADGAVVEMSCPYSVQSPSGPMLEAVRLLGARLAG